MKDYSAMDDSSINMLIGESFGLVSYFINNDSSVQFRNPKGYFNGTKNYCNNPADAWPIIVANKIWLRELYGNWDCKGFPSPPHPCGQVQFSDANPLRAAMIVYLMMKDAEKCDG